MMRRLKINSFAKYKHQVISLCLILFIEGSTSQESICHENKNSNCSNIKNYEFEVFKIALKSSEKEIYYQSNTLVTQTIGDQLPINLIEEYGEISYRVSILGVLAALTIFVSFKM
jgi:hypothetical protein